MESKDEFLRVDLKGKNESTWEEYRENFFKKIIALLDTTINFEDQTSIREESREITSEFIKSVKAKLKKDGIENQKNLAEIEVLLSQKKKNIAEARKTAIESEEKQFQLTLKKIRFSLMMMKAKMLGSEDENDIFFLKKIDFLLDRMDGMDRDMLE